MNIIVYCGASRGNKKEYENSAIQLGEWIAKNNHTLVFGGGNAGLMGTIANTVIPVSYTHLTLPTILLV